MEIQKKIKSNVRESYKRLRTNIQFSSVDNNIKAILVTSSIPNEGKTTICTNLAVTMAQTEKKVLIVDSDLRKPMVHKKFNISNITGLSNVLINEKKFDDAVQRQDVNLHILTAGTIPPNPSEILSSNRMKVFLDEVKERYDYIIIDSPPLMSVADAQVLAPIVEGILLVISSGETEIAVAKKSIELLKYIKANLLGVVLNKVKSNSKNYYYKDIEINVNDSNDVNNSNGVNKRVV